jgi:predicted DNA-binding transcriptional regulator YafY
MSGVSQSATARLLQLLALLQARRDWPGPELSDRLRVSGRTIRNDIARLRALGYPIEAGAGLNGGYRLDAGVVLPPLLLSDEEAVAVAISLRSAAAGTVEGLEDVSLQALVKLEAVLPTRLRHRMSALQTSTLHAPSGGPRTDPDTLSLLAGLCRDHQVLRLDYTDHDGHETRRSVEPHRVVHYGRRWFLLAWDRDREDWRTLRVDRIRPRTPAGARFVPRDLSDSEAVERVTRGVATAFGTVRTTATVHAAAQAVAATLPPVAVVEPTGPESCTLLLGAATAHLLAVYLLGLDVDFEVTEPPELIAALDDVVRRAGRAGQG